MVRMDSVDPNFVAILGFLLAIILIAEAPVLLAVLAGFLFVGWLLVRLGVFEDDVEPDSNEAESRRGDPLETLQTRYANGEITESEFERRLDRILESTEAAPRGNAAARPDPDAATPVDRSGERDVERTPETERT